MATQPVRKRPIFFATACVVLLAGMYVVQGTLIVLEGDSPQTLGELLQEVSFEHVEATNKLSETRMRSIVVMGKRSSCHFWNLEGLWGRCALASIDVLDYSDSMQPEVRRRASDLADFLAQFCRMDGNKSAALQIEMALKQELNCGKSWRPFRVSVRLSAVRKRDGPLLRDFQYKYFWNVETVSPGIVFVQSTGALR